MSQSTGEPTSLYVEKLIFGSIISAAMSSIIFIFFMSFRTYVSDPGTLVSYILLISGILFAGFFSGMFILEIKGIIPIHGGLATGIILGLICIPINFNVILVDGRVDFIALALIFIAAAVSAMIGSLVHSRYQQEEANETISS